MLISMENNLILVLLRGPRSLNVLEEALVLSPLFLPEMGPSAGQRESFLPSFKHIPGGMQYPFVNHPQRRLPVCQLSSGRTRPWAAPAAPCLMTTVWASHWCRAEWSFIWLDQFHTFIRLWAWSTLWSISSCPSMLWRGGGSFVRNSIQIPLWAPC